MFLGTFAYPNPGRSTKRKWSSIRKKFNDWVLPGVEDVRARPCTANKELIRLDLPTFDRPRNAISGLASNGQSSSLKALLTNSALVTFIRFALLAVWVRRVPVLGWVPSSDLRPTPDFRQRLQLQPGRHAFSPARWQSSS